MLKIRDGVDLKELEKYLIKLNILDGDNIFLSNVYCFVSNEDKEYIKNNCIDDFLVQFYINNDNEIDYCTYPEQRNNTEIQNILYELIKADLVEKVGE